MSNRVFSTYHPAYLLPGRNPSAVTSVTDHLHTLIRYLTGQDGTPHLRPKDILVAPPVRELLQDGVVSIDIETYGKVEGLPPQTQFHPIKSIHLDYVRQQDLIQTVALSYQDDDGQITNCIFQWNDPVHRRRLRAWFHHMTTRNTLLLGMNIQFDVLYLLHADDHYIAQAVRQLDLQDLAILSYLHNEIRPEKSLKDLAPLFNVIRYDDELDVDRYPSSDHRDLWLYNCTDTWATLILRDHLLLMIIDRFGEDTPKISSTSVTWYSDLLWMGINMSSTGVAFNTHRLRRIERGYQLRIARLQVQMKDIPNTGPLAGKNSGKFLQQVINDAALKVPDSIGIKLKTTTVRGDIGTTIHNVNLLVENLPDGWHRQVLQVVQRYKKLSKIVSSYLTPRLHGKGKKRQSMLVKTTGNVSYAYPSWYVVPSTVKDDSTDSGGVMQGRIVPRYPGLQTDPPIIQKAMTSRWRDGVILSADLSQIELRVAALLSGDERMMQEYREGQDKHTATTLAVFGDEIELMPDFHKVWRQVGKTLNFLTLYRGGAQKFRETLMEKLGHTMTLQECKEILASFWKQYGQLRLWQEHLIGVAISDGSLVMPITGASRSFHGGKDGVNRTYINEICNFPVQYWAATIMISAQMQVTQELTKIARACCGLQVYDSIKVECTWANVDRVREVVERHMLNPPIYQQLCNSLGRSVPLGVDFTFMPKVSRHRRRELINEKEATTKDRSGNR
jgi:DNA polymerase I-like protein with 3'-5' exonuclease and polymerase domains